MVAPAAVRAGSSIGPLAAQHRGNARIVSVLRFQLVPAGRGEGETQCDTEGEPHAEIAARHPDRHAYSDPYRKSAIDHAEGSRLYPQHSWAVAAA